MLLLIIRTFFVMSQGYYWKQPNSTSEMIIWAKYIFGPLKMPNSSGDILNLTHEQSIFKQNNFTTTSLPQLLQKNPPFANHAYQVEVSSASVEIISLYHIPNLVQVLIKKIKKKKPCSSLSVMSETLHCQMRPWCQMISTF